MTPSTLFWEVGENQELWPIGTYHGLKKKRKEKKLVAWASRREGKIITAHNNSFQKTMH